MQAFICMTCGTQYPPSYIAPASCPICEDDRQYVNAAGQQWTTLDDLRGTQRTTFEPIASGLTAVVPQPGVGIGQQAYLITTPHGNVLWDCIAYLDDAMIAEIRERGGLAAIAISHPHFHTTLVEWSRAFDAPVYIHRGNQPWVMRPDDAVHFWEGDALELLPGVTMIRCGGHFPGSSVLHWADGADGRGALFTGDTIFPVADVRWVTFMYSYPNLIPLDAGTVQRIIDAVEPYPFDTLYGSFGRAVTPDAHGAVRRSAARYIAHLRGPEADRLAP